MTDRREFLQRMLALVPASIIGRGFLKSANVPKVVQSIASAPPTGIAEDGTNRAEGWHLYESCGQSMFQVYGESGGLCAKLVAYLVRKKPIRRSYGRVHHYNVDGGDMGRGSGSYTEYEWECIPLEFNDLHFIAVDFDEAAVKRLINAEIAWAIKNRKPRTVNLDGGNLPRVTPEEREIEKAWMTNAV